MSDYIIGLTGGIASGKSTVDRAFAALGVFVADAKVAARDALVVGSEGLAEVVSRFGSDVLLADGSLDRPAMRRRVFADTDARLALEAIVHPRVRAALMQACADALPFAVAGDDDRYQAEVMRLAPAPKFSPRQAARDNG